MYDSERRNFHRREFNDKMKWHEVLGNKAIKDFQEDELIVL